MATKSKPRTRAVPSRKAVARKSPVRKPAVRKAPVAKATANPAVVPTAAAKPKKPKLVREDFTIPKSEFKILQELKRRAAKAGTATRKSEILRAGIKALAAMNDTALAAALAAVPAIKTGRPAKDPG